jgi:hypothetical protein
MATQVNNVAAPAANAPTGTIAPSTMYTLGVYSGRAAQNVAAWQAIQGVFATAGKQPVTAQMLANALATVPCITPSLMLGYLCRPNAKTGKAGLYVAPVAKAQASAKAA